jgi:hypothetical protein
MLNSIDDTKALEPVPTTTRWDGICKDVAAMRIGSMSWHRGQSDHLICHQQQDAGDVAMPLRTTRSGLTSVYNSMSAQLLRQGLELPRTWPPCSPRLKRRLGAPWWSSDKEGWYVSNVSIIFYAPCLFLHHLLSVLLHFVAFLCISRN